MRRKELGKEVNCEVGWGGHVVGRAFDIDTRPIYKKDTSILQRERALFERFLKVWGGAPTPLISKHRVRH